MRAAGMSIYRIVSWAMLPAVSFVAISLGVNQFVLPTANQHAAAIRADTIYDKLITIDGYWSVNHDGDNQDVVLYQLCRQRRWAWRGQTISAQRWSANRCTQKQNQAYICHSLMM